MSFSVFSRQSQLMQTEKRELLVSTGNHSETFSWRTSTYERDRALNIQIHILKAIQKAFKCLWIIAYTECLKCFYFLRHLVLWLGQCEMINVLVKPGNEVHVYWVSFCVCDLGVIYWALNNVFCRSIAGMFCVV